MLCSHDRAGIESIEMLSGLPVGVAALVGREHERAKLAGLVADPQSVTVATSVVTVSMPAPAPHDVRLADGAWVASLLDGFGGFGRRSPRVGAGHGQCSHVEPQPVHEIQRHSAQNDAEVEPTNEPRTLSNSSGREPS